MDQQTVESFLAKAEESLQAAESEYLSRRYNSCANRCYYACFQAAIAALGAAGIGSREQSRRWGHDYVQATFAGQLINRRKLYANWLGDALRTTRVLRELADYQPKPVTENRLNGVFAGAEIFCKPSVKEYRDDVQTTPCDSRA